MLEIAVGAVLLYLTLRSLIDLVLMMAMHPAVPLLFAAVLAVLWRTLLEVTGQPHLALAGAIIISTLVSRSLADFAFWLYDASPLKLAWITPEDDPEPFFFKDVVGTVTFYQAGRLALMVEDAEGRRERLSGGREPWWGYLQLRKRIYQEVSYREKIEPLAKD